MAGCSQVAFHVGIAVIGCVVYGCLAYFFGGMPVGLLQKILRFLTDFLQQYGVEIVFRTNDRGFRQSAFAVNVGFAELILANGNAGVAIAFPKNVRPMAGIGVERAAVVEYDGFQTHACVKWIIS